VHGRGRVLSIAPHIATLSTTGKLGICRRRGRQQYYLSITGVFLYGRKAHYEILPPGSGGEPAALFPWLPVGPNRQVKVAGSSVLAVGGMAADRRLAPGGSDVLLFRLLSRETRQPRQWAMGCALICLADAGFVHGGHLPQEFGPAGKLGDGQYQ